MSNQNKEIKKASITTKDKKNVITLNRFLVATKAGAKKPVKIVNTEPKNGECLLYNSRVASLSIGQQTAALNRHIKAIKEGDKSVLMNDLVSCEPEQVDIVTNVDLCVFLNHFSFTDPVWDKNKSKIDSILAGELVSAQLCEFGAMSLFLAKKNINMINPDGKAFDFYSIDIMNVILSDNDMIKDEGIKFSKTANKYYTAFSAKYSLVFGSIARRVKNYDNVIGISGKEGKQVLLFISYLVELGYTFAISE